MASYKLHAPCYLDNRYRSAGETVEFDGPPSVQMEPMDAEGWEAFHAYAAERSNWRQRYPFTVIAQSATAIPSQVEIPADWRGIVGIGVIHLARKLGLKGTVKRDEAVAFIESEVARRVAKGT